LITHTTSITRRRLRSTSWRSKRYSAFSIHRARSSMRTSVWLNLAAPLLSLLPRVVRPQRARTEHQLSPDLFPFLNLNYPACKRLIRRAFAPNDLPSLVEAILSSKDEGDIIRCLHGDDAQSFIDVVDEVHFTPSPSRNPVDRNRHRRVLSTRRWTGLISRNRPERSVSGCCIGCVAVTHFFR
jgi:hypothetical protein